MISDVDDMNTIFTGDFVKSAVKFKGPKSHLFPSFFSVYLSILFFMAEGGCINLIFVRFIENIGVFFIIPSAKL